MNKSDEENNKIIEHYEKIHDFAQSEINRISSVYKHLFWVLTVVFLFGISVGGFIIGKSISDIEYKYEAAYEKAVNDKTEEIRTELENTWNSAKSELNQRINKEFEQGNITNLVENTAQERIDKTADGIIQKSIDTKITPIKDDIIEFEKDINKRISNTMLDAYYLGARSDSKEAFMELLRLSKEKDYGRYRIANKQVHSTIMGLDSRIKVKPPSAKLAANVVNMNYEELLNYYNDISSEQDRFYNVKLIWENQNINENIKIKFFLYLLNNDTNLLTCYFVGKTMVAKYNLDIEAYEFDQIYDAIISKQTQKFTLISAPYTPL